MDPTPPSTGPSGSPTPQELSNVENSQAVDGNSKPTPREMSNWRLKVKQAAAQEALENAEASLESVIQEAEKGANTEDVPKQRPKRPAFDKNEIGGLPSWAHGKFLYNDLPQQIQEVLLKVHLVKAQLALQLQEHDFAYACAMDAGSVAVALDNAPLAGRCSYWRGIAELGAGNAEAAEQSFREARACKGRYIEGEDVEKQLLKAAEGAGGETRSYSSRDAFFEWNEGARASTPGFAEGQPGFSVTGYPEGDSFRNLGEELDTVSLVGFAELRA